MSVWKNRREGGKGRVVDGKCPKGVRWAPFLGCGREGDKGAERSEHEEEVRDKLKDAILATNRSLRRNAKLPDQTDSHAYTDRWKHRNS